MKPDIEIGAVVEAVRIASTRDDVRALDVSALEAHLACLRGVLNAAGEINSEDAKSRIAIVEAVPGANKYGVIAVLRRAILTLEARVGVRALLQREGKEGVVNVDAYLDERRQQLEEIVARARAGIEMIEHSRGNTSPEEMAYTGELRLDMPLSVLINELGFTARLKNCLLNERITTLRELLTMSERELLRIPNFGQNSLKELREFLAEYGITIGMLAR